MTFGPPRSGRDERTAIRRALIECVGERGYLAIDTDLVADRAGLSRDEFDRHFENLETCYAVVWSEVDSELAGEMSAAFGATSDWQAQLRGALSAGLRFLAADQSRARLYIVEAPFVNEAVRELQRATMNRLRLTIDLARGELPGADRAPPGAADAITGAIIHRVHHLIRTGEGDRLTSELPMFMYLAVMPFRGPAAAEAELDDPEA